MHHRALVLVNPHAQRGQTESAQAIQQLQAGGLQLLTRSSEQPQELSNLVRDHRDQVDLVIVAGGDGTLNAALAGLIDTRLPLGILPLGTANDLARTLGIPSTIPEACQVILTGQTRRIDVGWVNGQHFFNVASLGLSVQITQKLSKEVKQRWGVLAYAVTALQALWQARPFWAEIQVNNDPPLRVKTVQIAVGNGRYYGGGMAVAADAAIDDQRLDLYSLEIDHWWQLIALLPALRNGDHGKWHWVQALQGQEIQVTTRKPHSINTDGEITTSTPAHFRVIPKALSVVVPSARGN